MTNEEINDGAKVMIEAMDYYEASIDRKDPGGCRVIAMAYADWLQENDTLTGLTERFAQCIHNLTGSRDMYRHTRTGRVYPYGTLAMRLRESAAEFQGVTFEEATP